MDKTFEFLKDLALYAGMIYLGDKVIDGFFDLGNKTVERGGSVKIGYGNCSLDFLPPAQNYNQLPPR